MDPEEVMDDETRPFFNNRGVRTGRYSQPNLGSARPRCPGRDPEHWWWVTATGNPHSPSGPLISPHPVTGATVNDNERASFEEGILRAGQLEATCDTCNDVTDGSPVPGELDPEFPQVRTNSNGTGARHNADQCFVCHAQPQLGGSGGFIVPNPGNPVPQQAENPQFRLVPHRFGSQNVVPSFEKQYGPIREVRFKYKTDGMMNPTIPGIASVLKRIVCLG
jgi:hypothetical protein